MPRNTGRPSTSPAGSPSSTGVNSILAGVHLVAPVLPGRCKLSPVHSKNELVTEMVAAMVIEVRIQSTESCCVTRRKQSRPCKYLSGVVLLSETCEDCFREGRSRSPGRSSDTHH